MKSNLYKHPVLVVLLFDIFILFVSILQIINNKLDLIIFIWGFPLGYINFKPIISNNTLNKISKLQIIIIFSLTFFIFLYATFMSKY
jgi:hypothetical protein